MLFFQGLLNAGSNSKFFTNYQRVASIDKRNAAKGFFY